MGNFKKSGPHAAMVDYSLSVDEALRSLPIQKNEGITPKSFPIAKPGLFKKSKRRVSLYTAGFETGITTGEVKAEMRGGGFIPSSIAELIAFGVQAMVMTSGSPIFALGSIGKDSSGDLSVPYLGMIGGQIPALRLYSPPELSNIRIDDWTWQATVCFLMQEKSG